MILLPRLFRLRTEEQFPDRGVSVKLAEMMSSAACSESAVDGLEVKAEVPVAGGVLVTGEDAGAGGTSNDRPPLSLLKFEF
jgi:hypothetical protein